MRLFQLSRVSFSAHHDRISFMTEITQDHTHQILRLWRPPKRFIIVSSVLVGASRDHWIDVSIKGCL